MDQTPVNDIENEPMIETKCEPNRIAEAYRNYHPASVPAQVDQHLDFIQFSEGGELVLGSSNLTGRYWMGSLWFYTEPELAPDVESCLTGVECESGVCDGKFVDRYRKVMTGEDSGTVQVLDVTEVPDQHLFHFSTLASSCEHDDAVLSISVTKDLSNAVSASMDDSVKVWDVESLVAEHTFSPAHTRAVECASCNPEDSALFATVSRDGFTLLWDTRLSQPARALLTDPVGFTSVSWQPNSASVLAVGHVTGQVSLIDTRQGPDKLRSIQSSNRPIHRLLFAPHNDNLLAVCADDCVVKVLECGPQDPVVRYSNSSHSDFVRGLAWNPSTKNLYSCGWDKQVKKHILEDFQVNGLAEVEES